MKLFVIIGLSAVLGVGGLFHFSDRSALVERHKSELAACQAKIETLKLSIGMASEAMYEKNDLIRRQSLPDWVLDPQFCSDCE